MNLYHITLSASSFSPLPYFVFFSLGLITNFLKNYWLFNHCYFLVLFLPPHTINKLYNNGDFVLPSVPRTVLTHSRLLINICWMSEQMDPVTLLNSPLENSVLEPWQSTNHNSIERGIPFIVPLLPRTLVWAHQRMPKWTHYSGISSDAFESSWVLASVGSAPFPEAPQPMKEGHPWRTLVFPSKVSWGLGMCFDHTFYNTELHGNLANKVGQTKSCP